MKGNVNVSENKKLGEYSNYKPILKETLKYHL